MMTFSKLSLIPKLAGLAVFVSSTTFAQAPLQHLEEFLRSTQSGSANFTQVVSQPASKTMGEAGATPKTQQSTGRFAFLRPNRFKLNYLTPFAQTIVADGQYLWVHDVDLEQVTKRKQAALLTQTPLALIVQAKSVASLQKLFVIKSINCENKLPCFQLTPRAKDGQTQSLTLRLGSSSAAPKRVQLHGLEVTDSTGQTTKMVFTDYKHSPQDVAPEAFKFTPPKGVDVISQ